MSTPDYLSLTEAAALLRSGDVSSVELTRVLLDRIGALDDQIHAFLTLTPELALQQVAGSRRRAAPCGLRNSHGREGRALC